MTNYLKSMENNKNLSGLINSLKEECKNLNNIQESTLDAINKTEEELKSNLINLVFIGHCNAGKTTMINSLITSITNNYDNNVKLISSKSENTYFPIVIERSPNNNYHIIVSESNIIVDKNECENSDYINSTLEKMDDKSYKFMISLEIPEKETDEEKKIDEIEDKIPDFKINIKIPNFHPNLRLIDSPGLTNKTMIERLFKLLNENNLSIFIYLKSFTQEKITDNGMIYKFFMKIKESYNHSIFCICLTKYDQFLNKFLKGSNYYMPEDKKKKDKTREANKFIEKIQDFKIRELKDISSYVLISKIFINENKHLFSKEKSDKNDNSSDPKQKSNNMKNFIDYLNSINSQIAESIRINFFKRKMRTRLYYINQICSLNLFLNDSEINKLTASLEKSNINFSDKIKDWKTKFTSNKEEEEKLTPLIKNINKDNEKVFKESKFNYSTFEFFKFSKKEKIDKLKEKFDLYERTQLKDEKYALRISYVKDQYQLLSKKMSDLIEDDIQEIIDKTYNDMMDDLSDSLKEKFKKWASDNCKSSMIPGVDVWKKTLGTILSGLLGYGVRVGLVAGVEYGGFASLSFLSGPPGWIIGGIVGVGLLAYSLGDVIGIWKRENCFDDVIKLFYESSKNNLDEIIKNSRDKYNKFSEDILVFLKKLKETSENISKLLQIMNNYEEEKIFDIQGNSEELFKKALEDLEETDEIKNVFKEVIFG